MDLRSVLLLPYALPAPCPDVGAAVLDPAQRLRLERSQMAQDQVAEFRVLNINFYPKESHVVTFRDPWSFPVLFHPGCNHLIRGHLEDIAQKVGHLNCTG